MREAESNLIKKAGFFFFQKGIGREAPSITRYKASFGFEGCLSQPFSQAKEGQKESKVNSLSYSWTHLCLFPVESLLFQVCLFLLYIPFHTLHLQRWLAFSLFSKLNFIHSLID
jgi:hypothetical protein